MAKLNPVSIRLEAAQREALERAARERRRDVSELGRLVLADWLAELDRGGQRMYAFGYSTGADFAATLLLTRPGLLAGAVLLRPTAIATPEPLPELNGVPVLAVPGRQGSHSVPQLLARAGAAVDLAVQDADEDLIPQDFALAKRWLGQF